MLTKLASYFFLTSTALFTLSSQASLAGTMGSIKAPSPLYQPLVTLTIGPDFVQKGQAQTLTLLPPFQNHYTATHLSQTVADFGAFLGVERIFSPRLSAQVGVSAYIDNKFSPEGHVWQFGIPKFDNFTYSYHVQPVRIMLTSKLLTALSSYQSLHPYFSWEIGAALNRASNYQESPLIPFSDPMSPFSSHTETSFAWGLGLGMDYNVMQQVRVGIGYQFSNLGAVQLGRTSAATTNQTLSLSHLYTNQLRFQFTFLA